MAAIGRHSSRSTTTNSRKILIMETIHHYEVNVKWDAERRGTLTSPVLHESIQVATPPEFPQGIPDIWSPEHLFTAAVNSCLMTTFLAIAENSKLEFLDFHSKATGKLEMMDGKLTMSEIILEPNVVISHERDKERTLRILAKSEAACLISNSIKSIIVFKPVVEAAPETKLAS